MSSIKKEGFAFGKNNYKLLIIGTVVLIIGYMLMIGGGAEDMNSFNAAELFSFRRITLSPIVILTGFAIILFAIMKKTES